MLWLSAIKIAENSFTYINRHLISNCKYLEFYLLAPSRRTEEEKQQKCSISCAKVAYFRLQIDDSLSENDIPIFAFKFNSTAEALLISHIPSLEKQHLLAKSYGWTSSNVVGNRKVEKEN
ncbi:unnamed protein product [Ceratitis capitata]|uniref:(Mediterranean fruit fly) hypothetical protein n=1 Tax=Ceratitis capitata TaxID=7213 RepID=A0A811U878_CERCA|nr:unnamed protein product [Ceratitis capitata]